MRNKVLVIGIIASLVLLFTGTRYVILKVNAFTFNKTVAIEDEINILDVYENIEVLTNNAKVELMPTKSDETTVSFGGMKKSKVKFEAKVKGDTLSILLKEKGPNFFRFSKRGGLQLIVHVPEKTYDKINVQSKNGMIQAEELHAASIRFESNNGLLRLRNSEGDTVQLMTDNGQITISDVDADVHAQTANGRIAYKAEDIHHRVVLEAKNGRIAVKLSGKPTDATINAKTANGYANIFGEKGKDVTYSEGKHVMELNTKNGKITVEK